MNYSNLKYLVVVAFSIFSSITVSAQVYISAQTGYSHATNSGQIGMVNYEETDNSLKMEAIKSGLGQGINAGLTVGYSINENLAFEIGGNYIFNTVESNSSAIYGSYNESFETNIRAEIIQISPKIVYNFFKDAKINPYVKIGGTIGFGSIISEYSNVMISDFENQTYEYHLTRNGGFALGFNAGLGVNYKISEKVSLFSEVSLLSMGYAPTNGEVTKYNVDGVDILPELTRADKEFIFTDSYEDRYDATSYENQPRNIVKMHESLNNISLNFGLKVSL